MLPSFFFDAFSIAPAIGDSHALDEQAERSANRTPADLPAPRCSQLTVTKLSSSAELYSRMTGGLISGPLAGSPNPGRQVRDQPSSES